MLDVGSKVNVRFHKQFQTELLRGEIVRWDSLIYSNVIIKLEDGRYTTGRECVFTEIPPANRLSPEWIVEVWVKYGGKIYYYVVTRDLRLSLLALNMASFPTKNIPKVIETIYLHTEGIERIDIRMLER